VDHGSVFNTASDGCEVFSTPSLPLLCYIHLQFRLCLSVSLFA